MDKAPEWVEAEVSLEVSKLVLNGISCYIGTGLGGGNAMGGGNALGGGMGQSSGGLFGGGGGNTGLFGGQNTGGGMLGGGGMMMGNQGIDNNSLKNMKIFVFCYKVTLILLM